MLVVLLTASTAWAQTTQKTVTFQVDMTTPIANCRFTPGTNKVFTPGSLNGWNSGQTELTDTDGDKIYTGTATINATTGRDTTFFYKFFAQPDPPIGWEDDLPTTSKNREFTLAAAQTTVTLPVVTFNKATTNGCTATTANYEIVFSVDMSVAKLNTAKFNPNTDIVTVAGSMDGWNASSDTLRPDRRNPDILTGIVNVNNFEYPNTVNYKYIIGKPGEASPQGWEGGGNRTFQVTGQETDSDGNGRREVIVPVRYFDDVGPSDVFTAQTTITLEVDLRPAFYYLKDNGRLPNDTQTGEPVTTLTGVWVNGPAANASDGLTTWPWGPNDLGPLTTRRMLDNTTQGDLVAGDSIYTVQLTYPAGAAKKIVGKFGASAYDNEAVAGTDPNFDYNLATNGRYRVIFGAVRLQNGRYTDVRGPVLPGSQTPSKAYDPYICIPSDSLSAMVLRRGCSSTVAAEPVDAPATSRFTVENVYPNPTTGATRLRYAIPVAQTVKVEVFDLLGRRLETVVDETQAAGTYDAVFDARGLTTGVYVYRISAGGQVQNRTFVVNR